VTALDETIATDAWTIARVVASHDLVPNDAGVVRAAPEDWTHLLSFLETQRLCGLALAAFDAGLLDLSEDEYDELLERHEMQLALDLRIERVVLASFAALSDAGIDARLLKGPATSRRFYADPSLRSFGDADILVPCRNFRAAIDVVHDLGFCRKRELPRPWFDHFVKAACLVADDGLEIDMHQMLVPGPYGVTIEPDALFRIKADRVFIGQRPIPCLPPGVAFIHACVHAALGDPYPRFISLRDVVEILHSGPSETEITRLVRAWNLEPVIARALALVEGVLGIRVTHTIVDRYASHRPSRRDQWRLSAYRSEAPRFAQQSAATFWELKSTKAKVAYALALGFPARAYLSARKTTYRERVWRAVAFARTWRPR
jgi:hypothetical protein